MSDTYAKGTDGRAESGSDGPVRLRHHFTGAVQSRGFRYSCVKASGRAHVTGYVENQQDGTVVAETQGTLRQQEAFLRRLSAIMPGYGTEWRDRQSRLPLVEGEDTFSVRG